MKKTKLKQNYEIYMILKEQIKNLQEKIDENEEKIRILQEIKTNSLHGRGSSGTALGAVCK